MATTVKTLSAELNVLKSEVEELRAVVKELQSKATSGVNVNPRTHSRVEWRQQQEQRSAARANTTLEVRQLAGEMAKETAMCEKRTVRVEDFYAAAAKSLQRAAKPAIEELEGDYGISF